MTDTIDNGGDAFPTQRRDHSASTSSWATSSGMTLRDWFAGHAPAMPEQWRQESVQIGFGGNAIELDAAWRYAHADAMLAERAKP